MPLTFKPKYGDPSQIEAGIEGLQPFPLGVGEWEIWRRSGGLSEQLGELMKHIGEAQEMGGEAGEYAQSYMNIFKGQANSLRKILEQFAGMTEKDIMDPAFRMYEHLGPSREKMLDAASESLAANQANLEAIRAELLQLMRGMYKH